MVLSLQKRIATHMFNCGKRKAWLDPTKLSEIQKVKSSIWVIFWKYEFFWFFFSTKGAGIRELMEKGWIKKLPSKRGRDKNYFDCVYGLQPWPKQVIANMKKREEIHQQRRERKAAKLKKKEEKYQKWLARKQLQGQKQQLENQNASPPSFSSEPKKSMNDLDWETSKKVKKEKMLKLGLHPQKFRKSLVVCYYIERKSREKKKLCIEKIGLFV